MRLLIEIALGTALIGALCLMALAGIVVLSMAREYELLGGQPSWRSQHARYATHPSAADAVTGPR